MSAHSECSYCHKSFETCSMAECFDCGCMACEECAGDHCRECFPDIPTGDSMVCSKPCPQFESGYHSLEHCDTCGFHKRLHNTVREERYWAKEQNDRHRSS